MSKLQNNFKQLYTDIQKNKNLNDNLKFSQISISVNPSLEKNLITVLNTTPSIYDLYNFKGITYTNDPDLAVPVELYDTDDGGASYYFILPTFGYRVNQGVDPEVETGAGPWEYLTTINIVKTIVTFQNLTETMLHNARIVSYLHTTGNVAVPNLEILVDPYINSYTDYSEFYRWRKTSIGYDLEYYAFFPYFNTINLQLKSSVYFIDKGTSNAIQSSKI